MLKRKKMRWVQDPDLDGNSGGPRKRPLRLNISTMDCWSCFITFSRVSLRLFPDTVAEWLKLPLIEKFQRNWRNLDLDALVVNGQNALRNKISETLSAKKMIYVKHKSNQLVAALGPKPNDSAASDLYYKKKSSAYTEYLFFRWSKQARHYWQHLYFY